MPVAGRCLSDRQVHVMFIFYGNEESVKLFVYVLLSSITICSMSRQNNTSLQLKEWFQGLRMLRCSYRKNRSSLIKTLGVQTHYDTKSCLETLPAVRVKALSPSTIARSEFYWEFLLTFWGVAYILLGMNALPLHGIAPSLCHQRSKEPSAYIPSECDSMSLEVLEYADHL